MSVDMPIRVRRRDRQLDQDPGIGGYRVVEGRHGTALYGMIRLSDLGGLQRTWEDKGYTIWDTGIAGAIGATICATSEEGSRAWRAEIERRAEHEAGDDPELRWTLGCDTGRSAALILSVLGQSEMARRRAWDIVGRGMRGTAGAVPHDPEDLGRCVRLLDLFPAWRERLPEVAENHPEWGLLARHWPALEAMYREELPTGSAPRTLARMRWIEDQARQTSEATVDLSGLAVTGECEGPYFDALGALLDAMVGRHDELPDKLYVAIPPAPGGRALLWSRDAGEATMERAVRSMLSQDPEHAGGAQ